VVNWHPVQVTENDASEPEPEHSSCPLIYQGNVQNHIFEFTVDCHD
jgi:hypothetical protein